MKDVKTFLLLILFILLVSVLRAHSKGDTTKSSLSDKIKLRGYVKNMQTFQMADVNYVAHDNLIHNRLNFRFYPSKSFSSGLEIRNRVFSGDLVNFNPDYAKSVSTENGLVDLSWAWLDTPGLVGLSQIDRAWFNWNNDSWDVTLGRQRINWGVNAFWNSNDLFNTFDLVDFDYEERPGTDAIRVQRFFKDFSSVDIAIAPSKYDSAWIGAGMYKFNKGTYDFQVLTGWWNQDIALGAGWAGNLKSASFKGEVTYFHPQSEWQGLKGDITASISFDYMFKGNKYAMVGLMYGSNGIGKSLDINALSNSSFASAALPSAKNLMPTKYNALVSVSLPITSLISAALVGIYSPGVNLLFAMPSLSMSISSSWDFSIFGQTTFLDDSTRFKNYGTSVFARLKWGF